MTSAELDGVTVRLLSDEDLLVYLCVHLAKGVYKTGVRGYYDIAAVCAQTEIDWAVVVERAQGIERVVALGLWLARKTVGAAVPSDVIFELVEEGVPAEIPDFAYIEGTSPVLPLPETLLIPALNQTRRARAKRQIVDWRNQYRHQSLAPRLAARRQIARWLLNEQ
jgi:hypothetical protein